MKKIISLIMAIMMLASISAGATTVEFIIGDTTMAKVQNNTADRQLTTSQLLAAPFIANDRTMVPVRALSESFNCAVSWNADLRQVTVKSPDKEILLYIDSNIAKVNGTPVTLDVAPTIVGDITFVPIRFVTESMGYNVLFLSGINSVMVYDQPDITSVSGNQIRFPVVDILNYNVSLRYGAHPEEAEEDGLRNYSKLLVNLQNYYNSYASSHSLALPKEFYLTHKILNEAYASNFLKGEVSLLFGMFGTESAAKTHIAETNAAAIAEYYNNEYTCAKHILISANTHTEEEAAAIAQNVYDALNNGESFDALLAAYNEDPGMAQNPNGYLFTKGEMVPEFEAAAFALAPGAISAPVKSVYGYHIIQGCELPAITNEIISECVDTLYLLPVVQEITNALNGTAAN